MSSKLPAVDVKANLIEDALSKLSDEKLMGEFDEIFKLMPVTEVTECGVGRIFRGPTLQKFANKKVLVVTYGVLSLVFASAGSYFNGTITTLEKRFKIPSKNMGIISVGNDVSSLFLSVFISYYGGKSHRPRWIGVGLLIIVLYCIITILPHFIYGSGKEALSLTVEYGGIKDNKQTENVEIMEDQKLLCRTNATEGVAECEIDSGSLIPQILFFTAQLVAGIGQTICGTLGISYIDDNIKKSKTPALMSISFFMRLLGPASGYALASLCLKIYISPELTPVVDNENPRFIGAWWLGWIVYATLLFMFSLLTINFPRELPRAAVRKRIEKEKIRRGLKEVDGSAQLEDTKASIEDMIITFRRVFRNKIFMLMNIAGIFHIFGFLPYFMYTPKLIEIIYRQSASASSFYTGTLAIVFSGIGVLAGGIFISKFKPSARFLTMWHVICGVFCVAGMISYAFMGCKESEKTLSSKNGVITSCNSDCHCDFVKYSPVCGDDGYTYISACHAGCKLSSMKNSSHLFNNCTCIENNYQDNSSIFSWPLNKGSAVSGPCAVNCRKELFIFLAVMCFLKFIGATGRTSNFLISIRCIDEKDKSVAIGIGGTLIHLFAFIPSPIIFGYILDRACLVWGETCSGTGNCWLYEGESLRYLLNFTAAFFVAVGTIVDLAVWYFVKDLKIFDDEEEAKSIQMTRKDEVIVRH